MPGFFPGAGIMAKFTNEQLIEALKASAGFYSVAAEMLGCHRTAINHRVSKNEELKQIVEEINERNLDIAESKLLKEINSGNMTAIIFYLKCKGKKRGYIEKSEIDINSKEGAPALAVYIDGKKDGFKTT